MLPLLSTRTWHPASSELRGLRCWTRRHVREGLWDAWAGVDSVMSFLTAAEWARVHQAATHLCPGFVASPPARCDLRVVKELIEDILVNGLHEIEGWLDFPGAAEEVDILEQDLWNGGTQSTPAARSKVLSSLKWRLADFLEQAGRVRDFWLCATCEADANALDFVGRASAASSANPHLTAWRVCEILEDSIWAFVHRVAGVGGGDFTHEAAGHFVLLAGAVEECMKQAREMQVSLVQLEADNLAASAVAAPGPPGGRALASASAAVPSVWQSSPSACHGN